MSCFPKMVELIPEGRKGIAEVKHFSVGEPSVRMLMRPDEYVPSGTYAQLSVSERLMMTDTPMERATNYEFVSRAHGRVLVGGLGLGMVLAAILGKSDVTSVTVVEKHQDVVDLIGPHFNDGRLAIVTADILEWRPPRGMKYDTIYFDIWPDICGDNLDDMATLHRRFARRLNRDNPRCWMDSWQRGRLKALQRKGWR